MNNPLQATQVKKKFTLHVLGFAHLPANDKYNSCAYTQKLIKFNKMMLSLGHRVIFYGSEGSDIPCSEFVQTHTLADIRKAWGDEGNNEDIGYDWQAEAGFRIQRDKKEPQELYDRMTQVMINQINHRKKPDDFLCLTMGAYHKRVSDAVRLLLTVETGIGYRRSFANFRAFESQFIQNYTYGFEEKTDDAGKTGFGKYYDRVIPNYFDNTQFDPDQEKEDYMLYVGRIIRSKGIHIAIALAKELKTKLIIAGQGTDEIEVGELDKPFVEFVGYADIEKRKQLMAKARCFIYPTMYREPFGGSIVEAMLSRTPVLTTNFGAFPELVLNNVNGYRCDTFKDFVEYGRKIMVEKEFDHPAKKYLTRRHGEYYLMDNVKWQYQKWFEELYTLYEGTVDFYDRLKKTGLELAGKTPKEIASMTNDMKKDIWYRLDY